MVKPDDAFGTTNEIFNRIPQENKKNAIQASHKKFKGCYVKYPVCQSVAKICNNFTMIMTTTKL